MFIFDLKSFLEKKWSAKRKTFIISNINTSIIHYRHIWVIIAFSHINGTGGYNFRTRIIYTSIFPVRLLRYILIASFASRYILCAYMLYAHRMHCMYIVCVDVSAIGKCEQARRERRKICLRMYTVYPILYTIVVEQK